MRCFGLKRVRLRSALSGLAIVLGSAFTASGALAAGSTLELPWLDHTKQVALFHNMDDQQYTYGWLDPTPDPHIFKIRLQCENGQQLAQFHYTMNMLFKDKDGKIIKLFRVNCDLSPRFGGGNPKQFENATVELSDENQKLIATVALWGHRNGDTSFLSGINPHFENLAQVLLPVCWGDKGACREADKKGKGIALPSVGKSVFLASIRVNCRDTVQTGITGDHTMTTESTISVEDAMTMLRGIIDDMDKKGIDQCTLQTASWREVPGTRAYY